MNRHRRFITPVLFAGVLTCCTILTGKVLAAVVLTLSTEGVTDQVDYAPNLTGGGLATPETRRRFQAVGLALEWHPDRRTSLQLAVTHRELNSLRDSFEIKQLSLSAYRQLSRSGSPRELGVLLSLDLNLADQLVKNSYSYYNGAVIRGASIQQPRDRSIRAGLVSGIAMGKGFTVGTHLAAGLTSSAHDSMQGQGQSDEGCDYEFSTSGQTGSLTQLGSCGAVLRYEQQFANEEGVEDRLGFRASEDVAYQARFVEAGLQLDWTHQAWSFSTALQARQYFRGSLDQRISANGDTPTQLSRTASVQMQYRLNQRWSLGLLSTYQSAPFLDDIPMLYTAFTSERYTGGDVLSFQLKATLSL